MDVLAMLTAKHPNKDATAELEGVNYTYVKVEAKVSALGALKSIFTPTPYIVERFDNDDFLSALVDLLNNTKYDMVLLEGVFLGIYLDVCRKFSEAKVLLRAHNVEHLIWKRHQKELAKGLKSWYLKRVMIPQFDAFENDLLKKVDGIIAISPVDLKYFAKESQRPMISIPVAASVAKSAAKLNNTFSVGFLGALDWLPNHYGLRWFLDEVWSKFADTKDVQFQAAGRNFPDEIRNWTYPKVEWLGEIDDAQAFIQSQHVIIVPLFSGSGMRVKVIEAMSLGKCVLSTAIGAEGIEVQEGKDILIADEPAEWIKILDDLWQNQEQVGAIGARAKSNLSSAYDRDDLAKQLEAFILGL